MDKCLRCGRLLKSDKSKESGFGKVCQFKHLHDIPVKKSQKTKKKSDKIGFFNRL